MLAVDLKKTQVWVTLALPLLCWCICPYSGYPHTGDDEDLLAAEENLGDDIDLESVDDEDEDWDEETVEDAVKSVQGATGPNKYSLGNCINLEDRCSSDSGLPCCGTLVCRSFVEGGQKHCLRNNTLEILKTLERLAVPEGPERKA